MTKISFLAVLMTIVSVGSATTAMAGKADVLEARARMAANGDWSFDITIKHADTGWSHYADNFEILTIEGKRLGLRTLYHPHVNEQPFTRSLSGVIIPKSIKKIHVRAHDKTHGYGGREMDIELKR